jgi:stage V sporulation protein B
MLKSPDPDQKENQLKVFLKNSSWTFGGNILRIFLLMIKSIIVTRGLGVELYGVCSLVFASTGILQEIFNLNVGTTLVKFGAVYKEDGENNKLFSLIKIGIYSIILTSIFSTISLAFIKFVWPNVLMKGIDLNLIYILFAIVSCSSFLDFMLVSLLRIFDLYKETALVNFITTFIEVALISICFSVLEPSIELLFVILIASRCIKTIILTVFIRRKIGLTLSDLVHGNLSEIKIDLAKIANFTINNSLSKKVQSLLSKGDVLLLGYFTGTYEVGLYSLAKKLAGYVMVPIDPMMQSIFPQLSNLIAQEKFLEIKQMIRKITIPVFVGGAGLSFVMFFFPELFKWLIGFVFSEDFTEAWDAFLILFVNGIISAIFFWHLSLIQSLGLVKQRLLINTIAVLLGGTIGWFIIPSLKSVGTAITLTIANSFIVLALAAISYKKIISHINEKERA